MTFQQIEPAKWPSGDERTVAVLGIEPEQIEAAYGITFTRDIDDLDYHRYAGLRLPSGRQVMLFRYERTPASGTSVLADAGDDKTAAREELLAALNLSGDSVTWTPEDVQHAHGAIR